VTVFRFTSEFDGTQEAVNVWHVVTGSPADSTDADEAIVRVDAFFEAIKVFMRPGIWTHGNRVTTLDETPNRLIAASSLTTTTTGTTNAPASVAAGITWLTDFIGKSFSGRSFIGPLANGGVASDGLNINSSFRTALLSAAEDLVDPLTSGGRFCVWSEKLEVGTPITGWNVRSGIRTQRRRLT